MLHHLSSLRLGGGMCEAEEDAECLLVEGDGGRIRACDSLLVFFSFSAFFPTLIANAAALIGALNPFSGGKARVISRRLLESSASASFSSCDVTSGPLVVSGWTTTLVSGGLHSEGSHFGGYVFRLITPPHTHTHY